MSEAELQEIYEIYQEQQRIRQELEKQLENMINNSETRRKLVRQMEILKMTLRKWHYATYH
jgi:hypothetical protein